MSVFIDTSFFYGRITPRDRWHRLAKEAPFPIPAAVTTSLIINETVTLLQGRGFLSLALDFLQQARSAENIEIVYADSDLQRMGWDLLGVHGGSGANAVDCTSFALMKRRGIRLAYTFDNHFRHAGFQTLLDDR